MSVLDQIEAFEPTAAADTWLALDALLDPLFADDVPIDALPTLLRVFERFPRHDGHGVFWRIIHGIESIPGYEPLTVERVTRAPTEMGVTLLQRIVNAGTAKVGTVDLPALIAQLEPRVPVIDYVLAPAVASPRRPLPTLLAELAAFRPPPGDDIDWSPLVALVGELVASGDAAEITTPLLQTLDRFHAYAGFKAFWPIVDGLEQLPKYASALVASLQQTPTRNGTTLLLRLIARETYFVDGIDITTLAAKLVAGNA